MASVKTARPLDPLSGTADGDGAGRAVDRVRPAGARGSLDQDARDQLILSHLRLAKFLALRYRRRGEPLDDLEQVAMLALIRAVDRFDRSRGIQFATFATPTILGEIKRYFRDKHWLLQVPRRLRELNLRLLQTTARLEQRLGRSPTLRELAAEAGVSLEEAVEALDIARGCYPLSLDEAICGEPDDENAAPMQRVVGDVDPEIGGVDERLTLASALRRLPRRLRVIVQSRYFEHRTQSAIASRLGISQMQVSRDLRAALSHLKRTLQEDGAERI